MKVQDIYQDKSGQWHIEYSPSDLMALAWRVAIGEFLIGIFIILILFLLTLIASAANNSLPEPENSCFCSTSQIDKKLTCNEISN